MVRYVLAAETEEVAKAVEGYKKFMNLAERYADLVIKETRKAGRLSKKNPIRQKQGN